MLRAKPRRAAKCRRFASLCAAGVLLLSVGCKITLPMNRLLLNGPPTPGPLSSGMTPPLYLTVPPDSEGDSSRITRTSYRAKVDDSPAEQTLPTPDTFSAPLAPAVPAPKTILVNFDFVMRRTFENNGDILVARERVGESEAALDAAMKSCMPQALRKDTFKKPVAEATVWRRRAELRKTENDNLQDAANTYFDWLTALRGEVVARELIQFEEKLLTRSRKLVELGEKPAQVMIEATETALNGHRHAVLKLRQQSEAAAFKLASLMGMNGVVPTTNETLAPLDRVDTTVAAEVLVRQAQANGPGVRELQGLIASIQQGIEQARGAQRICEHTGAALICGRLQMAQSELQQAQLSLMSLQTKLRAGVEEAYSAIVSGREQIAFAADAIEHAAETYRIMDRRLTKENPETSMRNNTSNGVLSSIQQLSQAHTNYLNAVNNYNKAQARLLLLLGTYAGCPGATP
jgi:outer membrane protein TolC